MIAYRVASGTRIEALGDAAGEAPIANVPLRAVQDATFRRAGFEVRDIPDLNGVKIAPPGTPHVVFADDLYVSPELVRRFLREARRRGPGTFRLALREGALTRLVGFTGELPAVDGARLFDLWWVGGPGDLAAATPIVVPTGGTEVTIPFASRIPAMTDIVVPVTDVVAVRITSWVHLWMANLMAVGVYWAGLLRSPAGWVKLAWHLGFALLQASRLRPFEIAVALLARLVVRGKRCRIHPSAVVEACVLGDDVEIGPLCVVRGCVVGNGVTIMSGSVVEGCVLGDRVLINQAGNVVGVLAYPDAVVCWMQTGVIGRRAFLGTLFRPLDMKFRGTIRVRHRGGLVDTGLSFLGVCVGHRAVVAGDTRVQPGRVVPNDVTILRDPETTLREVPEGEEILFDRGGVVGRRG